MTYILPMLSVLLSFAFVVLAKPKSKIALKLLLAFSGAFLLSLTIFELLPEVYENPPPKTIGIWILIGILFQIFLEFFSKGAEHGHMHANPKKSGFPILLFISLSIHAILEGIPIESHDNLIYGILIHKIPIALVLSVFLVRSEVKMPIAILFMLLFALMTPLGSYLGANFDALSTYSLPLNALVIGIFLHISTVILFESSEGHSFNLGKLLVIVLGIGIAYLL